MQTADSLAVLYFRDSETQLQVMRFYRHAEVDSDFLFIFKRSCLAELPFKLWTGLRNVSGVVGCLSSVTSAAAVLDKTCQTCV